MNSTKPKPRANGDFVFCLDSFWVKAKQDDVIGQTLRSQAMWEPEVTRWMQANIQKGWSCLDIGMNNGYFTEVLARLAGDTGKVISFEPRTTAIDGYREAQNFNDYTNTAVIEIYPVGLASKPTQTIIRTPKSNEGASTLLDTFHYQLPNREKINTQKVSLVRLDTVITSSVDFIKIDIEGSEPDAFKGFGSLLNTCPIVLAELHPSHPDDFISFLYNEYQVQTLQGQPLKRPSITYGSVVNVLLRKK